ncbi:MAG: hypothetical protein UT34_C0001G0113 [candidate division WS6 bacterium GW2011_GWF2_39_15]|uniref:DUF4145 domain-containing protein n=1 Tax=candidate division WS6 bacterium GW2011_GWF2_39_15 TaxID=1619100 RepID=A0A0G0MSD0_9BACT|nr:MAG: hypothetical protein UT34_C0001G0113 [candidate division WS6 bacterium GW2011_GWF2_39_15]
MQDSLYITGLVLFLILVFFLFVFKSSNKVSSRRKNEIYKQMKSIKENIELDLSSANRDSIVRLDSILSKVLQIRNRNNLTCGENLKKIRKQVKRDLYEEIWYYHKLRNSIVHDDIEVSREDVKKGYQAYYKLISRLLG